MELTSCHLNVQNSPFFNRGGMPPHVFGEFFNLEYAKISY